MDRVYELEQRNEALLAKMQAQKVATQHEAQVSTKRKANGNSGACKRAKTQGNLQTQALETVIGRYKLVGQKYYIEEPSGAFMRHFYTLQKAIQRRPSRSNIVQAAICLCQVATKDLLSAVCEKKETGLRASKKSLLQTGQPKLTQVMRSVECAFGLLLQALQKLPDSENAPQDKGRLKYHLVELYQAIATTLERYCVTKSAQTSPGTVSKSSKNKQSKRSKGGKATQSLEPSTSEITDEVANQLSQLLGTMALSLDLSCPDHQGLFEGFLFTLLNRVGTLLCIFVFQDLQLRPDLHVNMTKLPLPQGLVGVELDDQSLRAAQVEARYLVWPVERALALLDMAPAPQKTGGTMEFVTTTRQKLQGTLLQAVFGSDKSMFPHTLQLPEKLDPRTLTSLPACTYITEQSVPEWFTREIWRLLGWELLVNKGSLKD
ncbi:uncharacterized protein ACLA_015510 [Aspergillus clavatus NRRL 1]|uniref:Uncharacterized protein n=1 Tax=Aspergillus clavatus (strain ATCC 1007 / CBS 513.65 / DSM 816 / NCTC 3887 / NRRL 1 / QM 1276 / 107) TaxID=344612 RepID=A1CBJ1_ASPCL|nr:uncharacterized protein ACLA_015510 [Aspergillus clavatus NRRL 1]EAW13109.1 conserved hypothetical protein [Aspergillus clavatus NRRL 1]